MVLLIIKMKSNFTQQFIDKYLFQLYIEDTVKYIKYNGGYNKI